MSNFNQSNQICSVRSLFFMLALLGHSFTHSMSTTMLETEHSLQSNSLVGALHYVIQDLIEMLNNSRLNNGYTETNAFNSLLIHGPDGNGKTTLAHTIAERTGAKLIELPGSFFATNTYDNARRLTKAFSEIEKYAKQNNQPIILLIDDAGVVKDHNTQGNLWCKLDDIRDDARILVILTTNEYLGVYDARLLSRMRILELKNPTYEQRLELLQFYWDNLVKDKPLDQKLFKTLACKSEGLSILELRDTIRLAAFFLNNKENTLITEKVVLKQLKLALDKKSINPLKPFFIKKVLPAALVLIIIMYFLIRTKKVPTDTNDNNKEI